jgi:hypothetical protein
MYSSHDLNCLLLLYVVCFNYGGNVLLLFNLRLMQITKIFPGIKVVKAIHAFLQYLTSLTHADNANGTANNNHQALIEPNTTPAMITVDTAPNVVMPVSVEVL